MRLETMSLAMSDLEIFCSNGVRLRTDQVKSRWGSAMIWSPLVVESEKRIRLDKDDEQGYMNPPFHVQKAGQCCDRPQLPFL